MCNRKRLALSIFRYIVGSVGTHSLQKACTTLETHLASKIKQDLKVECGINNSLPVFIFVFLNIILSFPYHITLFYSGRNRRPRTTKESNIYK